MYFSKLYRCLILLLYFITLLHKTQAMSIENLQGAFLTVGYCAAKKNSDIELHTFIKTEDLCREKGMDWVSNAHHYNSRHLHELSGEETALFIVSIHPDVTISNENLMNWEVRLNISLSDIIPSKHQHYFLVYMDANTVNKALKEMKDIFEEIVPLPSQWKISPTLNEAIRKNIRKESTKSKFDSLLISLSTGVNFEADFIASCWMESLRSLHQISVKVTDIHDDLIVLEDIKDAELDKVVSFLAEKSEVKWIDNKSIFEYANKDAALVIQSGDPRISESTTGLFWSAGIHGEGEIIGGADSGIDYNSCYFHDPIHPVQVEINTPWLDKSARKVIQYEPFADNTDSQSTNGKVPHGTHVMGSAAGKSIDRSDSEEYDAPKDFDGVAYEAKITFFDIGGVEGSRDTLKPPSDLGRSMFKPAYEVGARIHTNSWGNEKQTYDNHGRQIDTFSWNNQDFLIVAAAGNSGNKGLGVGTIFNLAASKNSLAVGASLNVGQSFGEPEPICPIPENDFICIESVAYFSSIGPTFDGRLKPDVVAPGSFIWSALASTDGITETCNYKQSRGSLALVRQYFREGYYPFGVKEENHKFTPMAAALKAVAINSGQFMQGVYQSSNPPIDLEGEGYYPNFYSGFGRIQLSSSLLVGHYSTHKHLFALIGDFDNMKVVDQNEKYEYSLELKSASLAQPLKVTLVWQDYPAMQLAAKTLVNNLDLVVTGPSGEVFKGNGNRDADDKNTVEQVTITKNEPGVYKIEIFGKEVPKGPQPFALAVRGDFDTSSDLFEGKYDFGTDTWIYVVISITGVVFVVISVIVGLKVSGKFKNGESDIKNNLPPAKVNSNFGISNPMNALDDSVTALPIGWDKHFDADGYPYYFNETTGESSWEKPRPL